VLQALEAFQRLDGNADLAPPEGKLAEFFLCLAIRLSPYGFRFGAAVMRGETLRAKGKDFAVTDWLVVCPPGPAPGTCDRKGEDGV
jgi:hypothetical protein